MEEQKQEFDELPIPFVVVLVVVWAIVLVFFPLKQYGEAKQRERIQKEQQEEQRIRDTYTFLEDPDSVNVL